MVQDTLIHELRILTNSRRNTVSAALKLDHRCSDIKIQNTLTNETE